MEPTEEYTLLNDKLKIFKKILGNLTNFVSSISKSDNFSKGGKKPQSTDGGVTKGKDGEKTDSEKQSV